MELDDLLQGNIPETLEGKTAAAGIFLRISKRIVPLTALLIASARQDHFEHDTAGWVKWCRDNFELEGSDRDHRRAVGELLLATREKSVVYNTLFFLAFDKLLSISRIEDPITHKVDPVQVEAFLSHYNVKEMNREEVRDAVALWLNEKPRERSTHPDLPGFAAALSKMDEEHLYSFTNDQTSATLALKSSLLLLGATLNYHSRTQHKNVELLQGLRLELLQGIEQLEQILAECCTQQSEDECCTQQSEQECCTQQSVNF